MKLSAQLEEPTDGSEPLGIGGVTTRETEGVDPSAPKSHGLLR
jgi:hypothetical protein